MNPRRIGALTRRIIAQFRRDPRTLALLFVAPLAIIALLGWVLRDQQAPATRVIYVNEAGAIASPLVDRLESASASGGMVVLPSTTDPAVARARLADRSADLAVIIPANITTAAASGTSPTIALVTAGLNPAAEGNGLVAFERVLTSSISSFIPGGVTARLPQVQHQVVYGRPDADTVDTLAPVFVGYFAYFFVFILTGVSFLRERIGGTLERLMATPITRAEIVAGYSLGFGIFAALQVLLVLVFTLMSVSVPAVGPLPAFAIGLGVPSAGPIALAYLIALVLGVGAVSLGIFLSTFARTELQVIQFIPIVIVPQGLLGGVFWPVDSLPSILQPVAHVLPVTYAVEGLREVIIAGADLGSRTVQVDVLVLSGIAALFIFLAAATIRREVA